MKCPKCNYLSFDPEPRCRNCGFSFSLADDSDVMIRESPSSPGPFADLDLRPGGPVATASALELEVEPVPDAPPDGSVESPVVVHPPVAPAARRPAPTTELPLFVKALSASDTPAPPVAARPQPPVQAAAEPRPPLSVRRKAGEGLRPRPTPTPNELKKLGPFDRDLLDDLQRLEQRETRDEGVSGQDRGASTYPDRVGPVARGAAAAIDATWLGATAAGVLWVTLRWCELPVTEWSVLPVVPTAVFLLLVGAGYLLMFTAFGGQTLGKMALGIRVVSAESERAPLAAVSVRQALYRAVLTLPSVLCFGLGFIPALIGDERAFHDRVAHTRVVRA